MSEEAEEIKGSGAGEQECGWCKWMKAGGCGPQFEVWLKCVDAVRDAGREDVETCASVMGPLWACMEEHADYYGPQVDEMRNGQAKEAEDGVAVNISKTDDGQQGSGGSSTSVAQKTTSGASEPLNVENITAEQLEHYLENLDKVEETKSN